MSERLDIDFDESYTKEYIKKVFNEHAESVFEENTPSNDVLEKPGVAHMYIDMFSRMICSKGGLTVSHPLNRILYDMAIEFVSNKLCILKESDHYFD